MTEGKGRILIVDDDDSHRAMLKVNLSPIDYIISEAKDGIDAVKAVEEEFFDLILMDIRMAKMGGIEALKEIKRINPEIPVLIMTAYASVKTAVEALKSGAHDYLTKPLDIEELKIAIAKCLEYYHLKGENLLLKERLSDRFKFSNIIGKSKAMKEVFETLLLVAPSGATVLISGESGTGKELVANAIHQNSKRAERPFIKVNCAALPETLLESELFGHEKGAFTGAIGKKEGRFELAHRGSLFLDEISEMSPKTQAKILRVLQEKEFERVGGTRTIKVDVRLIAATNKDIEEEVKSGNFREDLFYRLNVVPIKLPSLRERIEDISLLARHFLDIYKSKNHKSIKGFAPRTMDLLMRYDWPGNIRELENSIERGVIMCREDYLGPKDLPLAIQNVPYELEKEDMGIKPGWAIKDVEKELILKTLEETGGNRTKAAEILGVTRRTLQNKLKEYGIK